MSETAVKERPILFSAEMVRAILDGRKTQTRRKVKGRFEQNGERWTHWRGNKGDTNARLEVRSNAETGEEISREETHLPFAEWAPTLAPHGQPGDRLWVRETWQQIADLGIDRRTFVTPIEGEGRLLYAATLDEEEPPKWRPSIHMPRWASRLLLEITAVRVERLQEISEEDALAEGIDVRLGLLGESVFWDYFEGETRSPVNFGAIDSFWSLWESINGAGSWDANPWVWVYEFKRLPTEPTP